ncbi:hypothetical protein QB607_003095 [Clostridium botulinum]|nr:hypothetical protein [Clostridium botulinum]EKS4395768.1 hypothetical protein [Clostridium botulinum]
MKEILTMGDVTKDFKRLGVEVRQTYKGEDYGVCEVTDAEFKILYNEPEDMEGYWEDGGWSYYESSNQAEVNYILKVNNQKLKCWYNPLEDEFEDDEPYIPEYYNLLEYLCDHMGCSKPSNVCVLTKDLAKYNNMKLSELFKRYQG